MALYDKPVWQLMEDLVQDIGLEGGDVVTRSQVMKWFADNYPKVKKATIYAHLLRMSTNAPSRIYYHGKVGDDDLFFQIDSSRFRLYEPENDPPPIYPGDETGQSETEDDEPALSEFAYETDLKNFLSKNLEFIEDGLVLYDEEDIGGIEFPAGGRFIDILAKGEDDSLVVIELKVSRGYDRVVGQLLRYIGWIKVNLAEEDQPVKGIIVARSISEDLQLACRGLANVGLYEYELSVNLRQVGPEPGAS